MKKIEEQSGPTIKDAFEKSLTGQVVIDAYPYNGMSLHIKDIKVLVGKKNTYNVYFSELENGIPNIKGGDDPANYNPVMVSGTHMLSSPERSKIDIGAKATDDTQEKFDEAERVEAASRTRAEIDEVKATAKVNQEAAVKKAVEEAVKKEKESTGIAIATEAKRHAAEVKSAKAIDTAAVTTKK